MQINNIDYKHYQLFLILGICHVYVDKDADLQKALKIIRDSKCDYPAACNAMETLLIHQDLMEGEFFSDICNMLKKEGVKIYSGPALNAMLTFGPPLAKTMKHEYGSLECCIEVIKNMDEAISHIHTFGSGHTEVIVTENSEFFYLLIKYNFIPSIFLIFYPHHF